MKFKLGQEVSDYVWRTIEHQAYYESYEDYVTQPRVSKTSNSPEEVSCAERPSKRPRRQAAQVIKTYAVRDRMSEPASPEETDRGILDDEDSDDDSANGSTGMTSTGVVDKGADDLRRADQLALWIKNLADILHEEGRKVS